MHSGLASALAKCRHDDRNRRLALLLLSDSLGLGLALAGGGGLFFRHDECSNVPCVS